MNYQLKAYPVSATDGWTIEPAPLNREWMDQIPHRFAYRCLPLVMGNQIGWVIRCPADFAVVWNGEPYPHNSLVFTFLENSVSFQSHITSHFGHGIFTFSLPWLFRTSKGIGLMVRGATNCFKVNAVPLDAFVETDWSPYSFTMNWKILQKNVPVRFHRGDPICMLTPYPIALLEQVEAQIVSLDDDPELKQQYAQWNESRRSFIDKPGRKPEEWQKDYITGRYPDGAFAPEHRSTLNLSDFERFDSEMPE